MWAKNLNEHFPKECIQMDTGKWILLVHYLARQRLEHNSNTLYNYRGRMEEAEYRYNEL